MQRTDRTMPKTIHGPAMIRSLTVICPLLLPALFGTKCTRRACPPGDVAVVPVWRPAAGVAAVDDSDAVQGGGVNAAAMATDRLGSALVPGQALWLSHDGGRTWTAVTIIRR